jgi:glycosyltransferase involved in cell wall biosynthesis
MNIVLATMIKNESRNIGRLLNSCRGVATHYCVVDTGSTDNTVEVAEKWIADNKALGAVVTVPFKDFGSTRSATLEKARLYAKSLSMDLQQTYLLLLDADMILQTCGFKPEDLVADVIRITQSHGDLAYQNVRLLRASLNAGYIGRTHEYVNIDGQYSQADYSGLLIHDVGDGGCKADKFERDERLLKQDLVDNPGNARSMYYLGATYEALGKKKEAIRQYSRRMKAGGFDEEAWMAQYRRGLVQQSLGKHKEAEEDWLACWAKRPWRAEPLYRLAQLYLDTNRQTHACAVAQAALNIPYPATDILFIEPPCYHDEFHKILSIGDFYAGRRYDGAGHADKLILRKGAPHKENALANASWYMGKLPVKQTIDLGKMIDLREGWHACNPSIVRSPMGSCKDFYQVSVRAVNYTINPNGSYNYPGFVATETHWVTLNNDLVKTSSTPLQNPVGRDGAVIRGIEDVRLYKHDARLHGLGTRVDGEEDRPQIYDCRWTMAGLLEQCTRISAPGRTEKNWLPFLGNVPETYGGNAGPLALYATGPVLTLVDLYGKAVFQGTPDIDAGDFRGGAAPIMFEGGHLWVIHQVTVRPGATRRTYLHRFVWMPGWDVSKMRCSRPFCFQDQAIEFCSGMCHGQDDTVLLTYGFMDNTAHLAVVDDAVIKQSLGLEGR